MLMTRNSTRQTGTGLGIDIFRYEKGAVRIKSELVDLWRARKPSFGNVQITLVAGPRNHHCSTAAIAEIEYLGKAAMDIAVIERQRERPNPTRPQGKPRPQCYRRR